MKKPVKPPSQRPRQDQAGQGNRRNISAAAHQSGFYCGPDAYEDASQASQIIFL